MSRHIVEIARKAVRQYLQVKHHPAGSYTRYTITLHQMRRRRPCMTLLYATGATLRLERYEGRCVLWLDSRSGLASTCTDVSESELRAIAEGMGLPLHVVEAEGESSGSTEQPA